MSWNSCQAKSKCVLSIKWYAYRSFSASKRTNDQCWIRLTILGCAQNYFFDSIVIRRVADKRGVIGAKTMPQELNGRFHLRFRHSKCIFVQKSNNCCNLFTIQLTAKWRAKNEHIRGYVRATNVSCGNRAFVLNLFAHKRRFLDTYNRTCSSFLWKLL